MSGEALGASQFADRLRRFRGERMLELESPEARARALAREALISGGTTGRLADVDGLTAARLHQAARSLGDPVIVFLGPFVEEDEDGGDPIEVVPSDVANGKSRYNPSFAPDSTFFAFTESACSGPFGPPPPSSRAAVTGKKDFTLDLQVKGALPTMVCRAPTLNGTASTERIPCRAIVWLKNFGSC